MRMLSCVAIPTAGELRVLGMDPAKDESRIRARLGVVAQANHLDVDLTVQENMTTYARYFGFTRAEARRRAAGLLDFAQLQDRADSKVDVLSGGMQRRLAIARALVNDPDVVLLDEPTTGLDPQARHMLWERLFGLKKRQTTLLLSTHYMDEAEQLCDRLVIMDHGRIVAEGSPRELIRQYVSPEVVELRFGDLPLDSCASKLDGVGDRLDLQAERLLLYAADGEAAVAEAQRRGLHPSSMLIRRSTLEDVFLRLTGRELVE
jgi:lipooligosaccharide transport system ATP-binding protein